MIGRLHYATIAINILLVAILLAASLVFSNEELSPQEIRFPSLNLNQLESPQEYFSGINNLESLIDEKDKNKTFNLLYKIAKPTKSIKNPLLVIKPGHIAQTHLYQLEGQKLQKISSKTRYDFQSAPEFMGYAKTYNLDELSGASVYININHYRTLTPTVELWDYSTYNRIDNQYNQLFTAIFFGIFLLILVNAFFYLIIRRKEYLLYIFYNTSFLIFLMGSTGYIYQFPTLSILASTKNSLYIVLCLSMFALFSFTQAFLSTKILAPVEHKLLNIFRAILFFFFVLGFILTPLPLFVISITNLAIVAAFPLYLWLIIKLLRRSNRQAFFFALAFALLIFAGVCRILVTFNILPMNFIFNQGFVIASLLEATIFTLGLADRVLQIQAQRDLAKRESIERSHAYELQKDFSTLLNRITQKLHTSRSSEYETIVVRTFLKELGSKINFLSAAAIYQVDSRLYIYSKTERDKRRYNKVIKDNSLQIKRLCDINQAKRLESRSVYGRMFVIPVSLRRHEWSCLILEVAEDFQPTDSMLDFLQHYATELIRCLLNIESLRLIKTQAETDDLTQLLNRGAILERLELNLLKAKHNGENLSIAFIDVDNFKNVNDSFGHEAGDQCLKNLSKLLLEELPESSVIGRYGGDEFLIILPATNKNTAKTYFDNISQRIIPLIFEGSSYRYTISVGISSLREDTEDSLQLIRAADKALYVSKDQGKNQINLV